jgi:hypothetical protein
MKFRRLLRADGLVNVEMEIAITTGDNTAKKPDKFIAAEKRFEDR